MLARVTGPARACCESLLHAAVSVILRCGREAYNTQVCPRGSLLVRSVFAAKAAARLLHASASVAAEVRARSFVYRRRHPRRLCSPHYPYSHRRAAFPMLQAPKPAGAAPAAGAAASAPQPPPPKKTYGGLSDADRIFTNLYGDQDWRLKAAQKRVREALRLTISCRNAIVQGRVDSLANPVSTLLSCTPPLCSHAGRLAQDEGPAVAGARPNSGGHQGVRPAWARRGRLPFRPQVELHAQGVRRPVRDFFVFMCIIQVGSLNPLPPIFFVFSPVPRC